ncbi:hypothetical protein IEQ34_000457 [Dendrobium chrysotoxum]|uniref:Uncharacterized protein n=1 Tax=Dendrobium chrysotoxum TaxID=161865 RepID=A0AAV7HSG7_DENCH|nr:hypothetical protein IEQ34_000457 [Dendrobium chrysotoxum]
MLSARGEGALNSTQKGGSGSSDRRERDVRLTVDHLSKICMLTRRSHVIQLKKSKKVREDSLLEKEAAILDIDARTEAISLEATKNFKKSLAYHREVQNHVQEAYNKLFDVEARDLELRCLEEGFVHGFLKGARLVQYKAGVTIEELSPSQAYEDSSPDLDDEDVESELRKTFSSDDDDVEIM